MRTGCSSAAHSPISGKSRFDKDKWELYHLGEDWSQSKGLADKYPEKLKQLVDAWCVEAKKNNVLPLDDRTAVGILGTPRPTLEPPRDTYIYYPDTEPVPEGVATVRACLEAGHVKFCSIRDMPSKNEKVVCVGIAVIRQPPGNGKSRHIPDILAEYPIKMVDGKNRTFPFGQERTNRDYLLHEPRLRSKRNQNSSCRVRWSSR